MAWCCTFYQATEIAMFSFSLGKSAQPCARFLWRPAHYLIAVLLSSSWALAQPRQEVTFGQALQIALERNVALQKSERSLDLQAAAVRSARADFLPNLNLFVSPGQQYGLAFDQTAGRLVSETSESMSLSGSAGITLFDGFGLTSNLRQARATYEAADYSLERSRQDVLSQVAFQFLQVILDREQIRIQTENLEAQRQLLARIEEFTRVGSRPISELYQQQAAVAQSELQLLNDERSYQISQSQLIQILKLDPLGDFEFVAPGVDEVTLLPREYDLQDLFDQAFSNRADLKSQRATIEAADHGIDLAKSSSWPTVSLSASARSVYSSQRKQLDPDSQQLVGIPFGDQLRDNRGGSLGLSFRVPIFNRLQTRTAVYRAEVQKSNAELDYEAAEQRVALEVRQSFLDYLTAVKQLDVTDKQLQSAEQALAAEQERYNVGASTLVELTQSRAAYEQAAGNRVTAIYTFLTRGKLLDYFTGSIDPTLSIFE